MHGISTLVWVVQGGWQGVRRCPAGVNAVQPMWRRLQRTWMLATFEL